MNASRLLQTLTAEIKLLLFRQSTVFAVYPAAAPLKGAQHNSSRMNSNKDACVLLQFNLNSIDGRWQEAKK
jgi:hypothetical protein